jgi:hypothetical protein
MPAPTKFCAMTPPSGVTAAAEAGASVSVEIYDGMGHLFQAETGRNEAKVSRARLVQFIRAKKHGVGGLSQRVSQTCPRLG